MSTYQSCSALTSVTLSESMTSIVSYMFYGCDALTSFSVPNFVASIETGAFRECTSLTSITIPNSVTSIGGSVFKGCTSLTSITIPNSVTEIGYWAFQGCSALTSVTLSNSVREIKKETFKGCSSLSSVVVPNSVWKIEEEAFSGCSALESVTIPGSVWEIETGAFLGCTSLKTLILEDEDDAPPYELSLGVHTSENIASAHGLFADCPIENLYLGRGGIDYSDVVGDIRYSLWKRAFYKMKTLKKITLGSKITRMDIFWGYLDGSITICSLNPEPPEPLPSNFYNTYNEGYSADFSQDQYREAQVFVPAELWPLIKLIQIGGLLYTCKKLACLISPQYKRLQNSG